MAKFGYIGDNVPTQAKEATLESSVLVKFIN